MSLNVLIQNGTTGGNFPAKVTFRNQLVTAPLEFNDTYYAMLDTITIPFNLITPRTGKQFVIDGLIISGDRNINNTTGAIVSIFEADAADSAVSTKQIFSLDVGRLDRGNATGLNIITTEGVWINATTDDTNISVTLIGYYIEAEGFG
jgi:hypothetical protein